MCLLQGARGVGLLGPSPAAGPAKDFVGVFLLSTLRGSTDLGLKKDGTDYFARIKAARATWASRVLHFYSVVGNSDIERKALKSPSCRNVTSLFSKSMLTPNEASTNVLDVYRCQ